MAVTAFPDLRGRRFGRWLVTGYAGRNENTRKRQWYVRCECAFCSRVEEGTLLSGRSLGCRGCYEISRSGGKIGPPPRRRDVRTGTYDLTGFIFGSWTVLGPGPRDSRKRINWQVRCVCGEPSRVREDNLVAGRSSSCRSCAARRSMLKRHEAARDPLRFNSLTTREG